MAIENTHFGSDKINSILKKSKKIFFIGIGGVSMSSLAHITARNGFEVAGSDRNETDITKKLSDAGIRVFTGHSAENVRDVDAVVYTVAIGADNPEYTEAKRLGIPCISRADYLGAVMTAWDNRVGIAGMHGKSTCTGMCASIYMRGADPTVLSGAEFPEMGGFYRIGSDVNFIFEACEYMDSFLDFSPTTAVILNIEPEHLDYFSGLSAIQDSFAKFVSLTGESGRVVYNLHDENITPVIEGLNVGKYGFGIECDAEFCAKNIGEKNGRPTFDIYRNGEFICHIELKVPGAHNVMNALASASVALLDGIPVDAVRNGLNSFGGIKRRMEYKGRLNGAELYDDYGHHPTELRGTIAGARRIAGDKRLVIAFQPHTYSRTKALFEDFAHAFDEADTVLLAPIYAARESDDLGVSSKKLAEAIGSKAKAAESLEELAEMLIKETDENTLAVIMGAGNIDTIFDIKEIKNAKQDQRREN